MRTRVARLLAHLEAHIEMGRLLTAEQRVRYARLRGYVAQGQR